MKTKNIFFILFGIWIIDFLTTIISLNFLNGFQESNLISNYLYSLGFKGYLLFFLMALIFIFILSFFLLKIYSYLEKKWDKKRAFLIIIIPIVIFVLLELYCIINNIVLMLR